MSDNEHDEQIGEFYANGLQLAVSPFDITLTFGLQDPAQVDPATPVNIGVRTVFRPTVRVRMSPQLVVVVSHLLKRAVDDYEKQNGKIPISPELAKQFGLKL